MPAKLDATDGLAVAVCHFYQNGVQNISSSKYNSWQNFLTQNPDRVK